MRRSRLLDDLGRHHYQARPRQHMSPLKVRQALGRSRRIKGCQNCEGELVQFEVLKPGLVAKIRDAVQDSHAVEGDQASGSPSIRLLLSVRRHRSPILGLDVTHAMMHIEGRSYPTPQELWSELTAITSRHIEMRRQKAEARQVREAARPRPTPTYERPSWRSHW